MDQFKCGESGYERFKCIKAIMAMEALFRTRAICHERMFANVCEKRALHAVRIVFPELIANFFDSRCEFPPMYCRNMRRKQAAASPEKLITACHNATASRTLSRRVESAVERKTLWNH
jgi:hypothetical protein